MICIKCGAPLTETDFCMNCGANVKVYKRAVLLSNACYNDGLERARVRDLSGAIEVLSQSLKLNKRNIPARNLLGLVYFEMGEVVSALSQWIISKNLEPKKNPADDYIQAVQANPARLETINQTIKKYNQSLLYCQQGSRDLAVIQLKKVLSMNPKLVKAHQLLALLYMQNEEYERARKELKRALAIDMTNTITLGYLKELDQLPKQGEKEKEEQNKDVVSYLSGNETIIQPASAYKENGGMNIVVNILIGLVVGAALMWFLVMPAINQGTQQDLNQQIVEYSDQLAARQNTIDSLQQELSALQAEMDALQANNLEETKAAYEQLFTAVAADEAGDSAALQTAVDQIDASLLSEEAKAVFTPLYVKVHAAELKADYDAANQALRDENFTEAIAGFQKVVDLDPTYENGNALNALASAYEQSGDKENAILTYEKLAELFPGTRKASNAQRAITKLQES